MKGSSCSCGKTVALDRKLCPRCGKTMTTIEISNDAKVLTYTLIYTVPEGFKAPIFLVLVELEKGVKFLCQSTNEKDLEIGRQGKIVTEMDKYKFIGNK